MSSNSRTGPSGVGSPLRNRDLPPVIADSLKNSKAEYRRLGNSGLRVSVPIMGCMSYGNPEWMNWVIGEDEVSFLANPPPPSNPPC